MEIVGRLIRSLLYFAFGSLMGVFVGGVATYFVVTEEESGSLLQLLNKNWCNNHKDALFPWSYNRKEEDE